MCNEGFAERRDHLVLATQKTRCDGSVTGNNKVWKKLNFTAITTNKIRVTVNNALASRSRIVELEAYGVPAGGGSTAANINWLVNDQLGTPRMVFDETGLLATTKRHDYAPFGEELFNGARTTAMGYAVADSTRQKFTQKERDSETGLDYFGARYFGSTQGRFTSPDDFLNDAHASEPSSWNLYSYVRNNPLRYLDPTGETVENISDPEHRLTEKQMRSIAKDLQEKAGLKSIHFDESGKLTYNSSEEVNGGSAHFRQAILGAINDTKNTFQLASYSGDSEVDFTNSRPTDPKAGVFEIRIDFGDYTDAKNWSDSRALTAFSIGLNLYHEIDHHVSYDPNNPVALNSNGDRDDVGSSRGPGVIDDVNVAQRELNLMIRAPGEHGGLPYNGPDSRLKNTNAIQFNDAAGKSRFVRWRKESSR